MYYCNLAEAPDGLTNTAALMVRGLVNSVQLQNENMQPAAKGVSRGDTSFSFATAAEQLAALSYGNQDISQWAGSGQNQSQELNGFWIDSSLKISPVEQVQVLAEIFQGESPYTPEEVATLQKIMLVQDQGEQQVYGKTGTGFGETGWFVGFTQENGQKTYFAVYLSDESREISGSDAQAVALALLE